MKTQLDHKKIWNRLCAVLLLIAAVICLTGLKADVFAQAGKIYSCTVIPSYRNPETGNVEDSGGESSYATGQGMVESCVGSKGMLEETESGEYYLTFVLSLMDYSSGHTFLVKKPGSSDWIQPAIGVTGTGTDSNGTTNNVCIQIPGKDGIIKGSMYVEPMGRNVTFFITAGDFQEGTVEGLSPTIVTETGKGTSQSSMDMENSEAASETPEPETATDRKTEAESRISADADGNELIDQASGLNLSVSGTGTQTEEGNSAGEPSGSYTVGEQILINIVSWTVTGLFLIGALSCVGYVFRRNWYRWGGVDKDDYSEEYEDEEE